MPDLNSPNRPGSSSSSISGYIFPADLNQNYMTAINFIKSERAHPLAVAKEKNTGVIYLPLPNSLPESYAISYNDVEIGNILSLIQKYLPNGISAITNAFDTGGFQGAVDLVTNTVMNEANRVLNGEYSAIDIMKAVYALTGRGTDSNPLNAVIAQQFGAIPNPHLTTIFNGVGLRGGEFSWNLSPRNKQESFTLNNIINTLRLKMHPSLDTAQLLYKFPEQVTIDFYPNFFLTPFKKSVIKGFAINNSPAGHPTFYSGGAPTAISITLSVTEVEPRTQLDFGGGGTFNDLSTNPGGVGDH